MFLPRLYGSPIGSVSRLHSLHAYHPIKVPVVGVNLHIAPVEHLSGDKGVGKVYTMLSVEMNGIADQGFAGHPGASQGGHVIGKASDALARPTVKALQGPDDIAKPHFRQVDLLLTGLETGEESLATLCLLGRFI